MQPDFLKISDEGELVLSGDWTIDNSARINAALAKMASNNVSHVDATAVGRMDVWGVMRIEALARQAQLQLNPQHERTFLFLSKPVPTLAREKSSFNLVHFFENIGQSSVEFMRTVAAVFAFIGEIAVCFVRNLGRPKSFRFHSIIRHIDETGLRALPIIGLLAVLISMVISYQAATQLQKFGANIFTIDLTVISLLREMGVLVTAIMVAGRSGSAFAAEIGVMKLREEVDALKTMGFNPIEILVLPRLIAMMITLPILAFLADIMGLAGGGIISIFLLDIPLDQYVDRVEMVANPTMFFVGLIKAPVFAFVITIIGTYQGMNVSGSAESVGRLTTVAVVQSIFLVIMIDALFSIVFSKMGL